MESSETLELLTKVSSALFENLDRTQLIHRILDIAIQLTCGDRGSIFLPLEEERKSKQLTSLIATGLKEKKIRVKMDEGIAGHVFMSKEPIINNHVQSDPRFFRKIDEKTNYKTESILCVPMQTPEGEVLGVLEILNSKSGSFKESELRMLQILSVFAVVAIEQKEVMDSLTELNQRLNEERNIWTKQNKNYFLKSKHQGLQKLYEQLPAFAKSDSSILIEGESGTGKEVIARKIHFESNRTGKSFIALNCGAIPESLFEAELFGVAKGAATGTSARRGKIELAEGGTLFLDEIGELPFAMQSKLLRVLQEKAVTRVGSEEKPRQIDFRIITATNRNLEEMIKNKCFREDLYYRINVIRFRLPSLSERFEDIPDLCESILKQFTIDRGWKMKNIDHFAIKRIKHYSWPGNIRQLQNKLESAMILSGERLTLEVRDLQLDPIGGSDISSQVTQENSLTQSEIHLDLKMDLNIKSAKEVLEEKLIKMSLKKTKGNKSVAAKLLGLTREGLRKAMQKF